MKTKKSNSNIQRRLIDDALKGWLERRADRVPPSGWIKAIRGALGITTRQLAERLGIQTHSTVVAFENAEKTKKISLDVLSRVADAMDCKLVYAIVPKDEHGSLEAIIDHRAELAAKKVFMKVQHTMRLESQGVSDEMTARQINDLAKELKDRLDPSLWSVPESPKPKRRQS